METATLLPWIKGIQVNSVHSTNTIIELRLSTNAPSVVCPLCGQLTRRVHSRYQRTLADLPWNRVAVRIRLHTRKLFCQNLLCQRRIFTEPLPQLVAPYARKTASLQQALYLIGYALGGRAGAHVAIELGLVASPDTVLRRIRQVTNQHPSTPTALRVVGIDDFAFRKGHRYGTILVDLESRRLVDLLPERACESVAAWLKRHPDIEIISRDRATVYAEGATAGRRKQSRWQTESQVCDCVGICYAIWAKRWNA